MDNLLKELVDEFKKEEKKYEKKGKEINKACKIVAESNEDGSVGSGEIKGNQQAILSMIRIILKNMEEYGEDSATNMAAIILTTLEIRKEMND